MQFNSYSYLLSLPIVVAIFWMLPIRARRAYVVMLSLAFCATWNLVLIALPLAIALVTYGCATLIRHNPSRAPILLRIGIGLIVTVLAFFKYRGFLTGASWFAAIGLPLGISFYSFEAISYLIDTRQGRTPSRSFADLWLFLIFWPHLIAGPIVRSRELLPQFSFDKRFEPRFAIEGLDRLLLGLVQKNVIANSLAPWVDDGFVPSVARLNTTLDTWCLAVAFGLQIYFDFAAYSNMAIGAAKMIGIVLPENFNSPYHAANPADFWSRWHMTLSRWIRDYVFFPLNAGLQTRKARLYLSLVGVMGVVGLWHGAGWGFVVWGVMHGVYLVLYRAIAGDVRRDEQPMAARMAWRAFTLAAVAVAWVPFRSTSLAQTATMLARMFRYSPGWSYSVNFYLVTLLVCALCALEPLLGRVLNHIESVAERSFWRLQVNLYILRPVVYACLLLLFIVFDDRDMQFIYFQF
jgi:D-alanyl-lipoteichoic acid acyltransferase DltB (MBOAT superfamily)